MRPFEPVLLESLDLEDADLDLEEEPELLELLSSLLLEEEGASVCRGELEEDEEVEVEPEKIFFSASPNPSRMLELEELPEDDESLCFLEEIFNRLPPSCEPEELLCPTSSCLPGSLASTSAPRGGGGPVGLGLEQGVGKLVNHPTALSTHAEDLVNRAASINELHAEDIAKCAHILEKFTKRELSSSKASFVEKVIPADVVANCKGIAIMTVLKAGFIWSGRTGTGLVVSRLDDGTWSAPSAIGTVGAGVGGQIGAELTDFVIILNTQKAVEAFSMGGNVTLGGNLSVAAGPFGRSAEAGGAVGKLAPIYSYSKTKGLFAGVSIEGSVIVERKDANHRFYGQRFTPKEILSGKVARPVDADPLYKALERQSKLTTGGVSLTSANASTIAPAAESNSTTLPPPSYYTKPIHQTNKPAILPRPPSYPQSKTTPLSPPLSKIPSSKDLETLSRQTSHLQISSQVAALQPPTLSSTSSSTSTTTTTTKRPAPPPIPKRFVRATALYDFEGERDSDLSFRKGDEITVTKKTASTDDWWTGQLLGRTGDFPANYVEIIHGTL